MVKTSGADRESRCYPVQGKALRIQTDNPPRGHGFLLGPRSRTVPPPRDPRSAEGLSWLVKTPFQP
ncbi:hypothetical protein [Umezawaea tangerina]|uniref:Uncharacterized protein n=1 Tax=Umezawaea tangerina TaxID=84725 RepID=A0A2T0TFY6_9PSEU|nr:hypothetical protein [Umezawaea tangerina]PRY44602.1 hypothetical protein CLV43_102167 [Umezawaea tangerina]